SNVAMGARSVVSSVGVLPADGAWTGGYEVVISGMNLGNGGDITNVTLCGVAVQSIVSQSATQVVVVAGQAISGVVGDVQVFSASFGATTKSNAFTYTGAGIAVNGTSFGHLVLGTIVTNLFAVTNSGNEALVITAATNSGAGAAMFNVTGLGGLTVAPGTVSNVPVVFTASAVGTFMPTCRATNNSPLPNYTFGLTGSVYAASTNVGPYGGGNTITITNGHFGTITNVLLGALSTSSATLVSSGPNWFTITLPAATNAGAVDFIVQTSDNGDITLTNPYAYNPQGWIGARATTAILDNTSNGTASLDISVGSITLNHWNAKVISTPAGDPTPLTGMKMSLYSTTTNGANTLNLGLYYVDASYDPIGSALTSTDVVVNLTTTAAYYDIPLNVEQWTLQPATNYALVFKGSTAGITMSWPIPGSSYPYITTNGFGFVKGRRTTTGGSSWYDSAYNNGLQLLGNIMNIGVEPSSGSWTGGYPVAISGDNLCNGTIGDVTLVTLAGMTATVQSVNSATQVVVMAGASHDGYRAGDVVVVSTDYGTTVKSNAYEYLKEAQSITFDPIAAKTYGDAAFDPGAMASSGLTVGYASSNSNVATNLGTLLYITGTGVCNIVASQAGNAFYVDALNVTNTLTVTPKGLTVSGASASNKVYDATVAAMLGGGSLVGVVPSDTVTLANSATGTFAQATIGTNIAVTSFMTLSGADAPNYTLSQPSLAADIIAKGLTVTGAVAQGKVYDGTIAATVSGAGLSGVESGDAVTLDNASTGTFASANADTNIAVTSYMTISGADSGNYNLGGQPSLSADITKADQTITFPALSDTFWTNRTAVSATADSGLAVAFAVLSGPAQLNSGTNVSFTGIGDVRISASQSGNANYNAAPVKTNSFLATGPQVLFLGTDGAVVESGAGVSPAAGTAFGEAIIGGTALTNVFAITNAGNALLTFSGVVTNGIQVSSFILHPFPLTLAAGAATNVTVVFAPLAGGSNTASFVFSFDGTNSPYTMNVAGVGLGGGIALATNLLAFTGTYAATNPPAQVLMMSNVGVSGFTWTNSIAYSAGA
ncbi:MAG TPA: hypothetical protein DCS43_03525, partial [Verrucomicrobia bacterium]|nr:hypothetical protein [Verrucomicrobiota bacterium]